MKLLVVGIMSFVTGPHKKKLCPDGELKYCSYLDSFVFFHHDEINPFVIVTNRRFEIFMILVFFFFLLKEFHFLL